MADIGQFNKLSVIKKVAFGVYLDGGRDGEILLPNKFVPVGCKPGDELDVFVHHDSEDRVIATTQRPRAVVGNFAYLEVVSATGIGAFLDWGLSKDLFVPRPEQMQPMEVGKSYIVYINLDNEGRVMATAKIDKFLDQWPVEFEPNEEVTLLVANRTDLGIKAIVNNHHWGLLHNDDLSKPLRYGKKIKGFIKNVRDDEKIDLILSKPGYEKIGGVAGKILDTLEKSNGFLPLHDKSSPEQIKHLIGESKKTFKRAIGDLYKQRKIDILKDGIRLKD